MKSPQNIARQLWDKLLVIIGALCVLLPVSPMNMRYSYRDSGVFLYMGWRILNGELPYRDIWDHKPPIIFYINALGLAITNGSRWGVWMLEFLSLSLAAFIGFKIVQKALGTFPAIFSTLLWLLTLVFVVEGGNLTTEYTLPLQFAALWLSMTVFDKPNPHHWRWLLIGSLGATAFFTKQTTIGIWISIILFLVIYRMNSHQINELIFEVLFFFCGVVAVCIVWIAFFGLQGGLPQFWNAAFEFNFVYSSSIISLSSRLKPIIAGITPLTQVGLLQFAGIGYLLGLLLVCFKRDIVRSWLPLLVIGLFNLPIELLLISVSGKTYPHYYMTILPGLALFTAIPFWTIFSSQLLDDIPYTAKYALTVGIIGVFLYTSFNQFKTKVISFRDVNRQYPIVSTIELNTSPEDTVLMWGAEASINYFSQRRSPTRYVYQYPLYTQGYTDEQMIVEFLDDLILKRPRLIIDTYNTRTPLYDFPINTPTIQQRIAYLECHYRIVDEIFLDNWTTYEYAASDCN
jgi:hypothetical protein